MKRDNYLSFSLSGRKIRDPIPRFERGNRIRWGYTFAWLTRRQEGRVERNRVERRKKKGCSTWYLQTAISRNGIDVANKLRNGWTKGEGNSLRNACELINLFALITSSFSSSSSSSVGGNVAIGWGPFHDVIRWSWFSWQRAVDIHDDVTTI